MNRFLLLLSYRVINCMLPSTIIGNINIQQKNGEQSKNIMPIGHNNIPINSPVHLAQIGNGSPLQQKERSFF